MLKAPGEVPPEILAENRQLVTETLEKLNETIKVLDEAKKEMSQKNNDENIDIISKNLDLAIGIEVTYGDMIKGKLKKEEIAGFEDILDEKLKMLKKNEEDKESKEIEAVESVLDEVETYHKLILSKEIQEQLLEIQDIIHNYDEKEKNGESLDKDDKTKRQLALKIARKKVQSLEKAGISEIINDGDNTSKSIITKAKEILLPNLEKSRASGEKEFQEKFVEQEDEEPNRD